jgi:hypothetical protein
MLSQRLVDANLYVPWAIAKNLLSNISVQLLSDLVRARALANPKAFPCGGWLLDGDTVWLRSPAAARIGKFGLPKFGHFLVLSMPASEKTVVPTVASFIDLAAQPALRVGGCRTVRGAGAGTRLIGATDQVPSRPSGKHESPHQIRCLACLGRFLFEATVRLCIHSNALPISGPQSCALLLVG